MAMSLAEKCGDTLIIHVEKALYSHQGAYPTLVQAFAAHFGGDCTYINREDDAGDQGLRTSKLQYLPVRLAGKLRFEVRCEADRLRRDPHPHHAAPDPDRCWRTGTRRRTMPFA